MKEIYVLLPLLKTNSSSLEYQIERILNTQRENFTVHELQPDKIAIQIANFPLGYTQLNQILEEHQRNADKLIILEEALRNYDAHTSESSSIHPQSMDSLMKKAQKYKDIKEENKKLRKLLQNQLQNTQKVRDQTQKTMKVLREQFDALVTQMNRSNAQKDKTHSSINSFSKQDGERGGGQRQAHNSYK